MYEWFPSLGWNHIWWCQRYSQKREKLWSTSMEVWYCWNPVHLLLCLLDPMPSAHLCLLERWKSSISVDLVMLELGRISFSSVLPLSKETLSNVSLRLFVFWKTRFGGERSFGYPCDLLLGTSNLQKARKLKGCQLRCVPANFENCCRWVFICLDAWRSHAIRVFIALFTWTNTAILLTENVDGNWNWNCEWKRKCYLCTELSFFKEPFTCILHHCFYRQLIWILTVMLVLLANRLNCWCTAEIRRLLKRISTTWQCRGSLFSSYQVRSLFCF